ncbi:hypothetical protein Prum_095010 [Phytohabitans rumicis]|uniref:Uncharacterized protein n=1 Tax=Phytohabitans rumicis TaxID=1076125 RepID=A0A6V8LMM3_9ACTN|nr:hypothetical protein Prum_095010 [Phytohabitans rumicis]
MAAGLTDSGGLDIDAAVYAYFAGVLAERDGPLWERLATLSDPVSRKARLQLWATDRSSARTSRTASISRYGHTPGYKSGTCPQSGPVGE